MKRIVPAINQEGRRFVAILTEISDIQIMTVFYILDFVENGNPGTFGRIGLQPGCDGCAERKEFLLNLEPYASILATPGLPQRTLDGTQLSTGIYESFVRNCWNNNCVSFLIQNLLQVIPARHRRLICLILKQLAFQRHLLHVPDKITFTYLIVDAKSFAITREIIGLVIF